MRMMRVRLQVTAIQKCDHPVYERETVCQLSDPFDIPYVTQPGLMKRDKDIDLIWSTVERTNNNTTMVRSSVQQIHLGDRSEYTFILWGSLFGAFYNDHQHIVVHLITPDLAALLNASLKTNYLGEQAC